MTIRTSVQRSAFSVGRTRHGVVLIVILGMLFALALIGIAFTTFSAQEANSSRNFAEANQNPRVDLDPMVVLLEAIGQLVADTNNPHSAVRGHSMLRDMYGNDNDLGFGPDGQPGAAGVDDDQDGITDNMSELGWPGSDDRPNGVIDVWDYYARAFNGVGETGPDGVVGTPLGAIDDWDVNYVYNRRQSEMASFGAVSARGAGADEDYDYPDFNNMFMGAYRADGRCLVPAFHRPGYLNIGGVDDWAMTTNTAAHGRRLILRPRLAEHPNFGPGNLTKSDRDYGVDNQPGRAMVDDDGNGTTDDASEYLWPGSDDRIRLDIYDVDNDGDGITDSVWIDIGFAVQTTLNGRKFKPLVAFKVMDMDGKLNLNAHGNLNFATSHTDYPGGSRVPLGHGASVAEANLENLFGNRFFPSIYGAGSAEYRQLFEGATTTSGIFVPGKWGEVGTKGTTASPSPLVPRPGRSGTDDTLTALGLPGAFNGFPGVNGSDNLPFTRGGYYGTPDDPDGDAGKFLDLPSGGWRPREVFAGAGPNSGWGNTVDWAAFTNVQGETTNGRGEENIDEPTELNLYTSTNNERPFTPEDVESAYRFQDVDGSQLIGWLPGMIPTSRLAVLAPNLFRRYSPGADGQPGVAMADDNADGITDNAPELGWPGSDDVIDRASLRRRSMIGVGNWDVRNYNMPPLFARESSAPLASFGTWNPAQFNGSFPGLRRVPPILAQRPGVSVPPNTPPPPAAIEGLAIPDSIRRGKRLNVAPLLTTYAEKRRLFRDLYVTMIQLCGAQVPADRVAQWCANVVEFQDTEFGSTNVNAEERMNPFEFDNALVGGQNPDPAKDGFYVDGDHLTASGDAHGPDVTAGGQSDVVWGAECPRLVISETLAYESSDGVVRLFIELYNISDKTVDLRGTNNTYELIWGDANGMPTSQAEPDNSFLTNRMVFDMSAPGQPGLTMIPPGTFFLIAPEPVPNKLNGTGPGALMPTVSYTPAVPFAPPGTSATGTTTRPFRLFLRRLADPTQAEDTMQRGNFPRSANPYITTDALDFLVFPSNTFNSPSPFVFGTVVSNERKSLSVDYLPHPPLMINPATNGRTETHSLSLKNRASTEVMPRIPWLDRPFSSTMEMMLVPAVSAGHLTTAFMRVPLNASPYLGKDVAGGLGEDPSDLETGVKREAPFKNSNSDYLYSYLLNFMREDPNGQGPPTAKGKSKGVGVLPPSSKKPQGRRVADIMPTPGFYRLFEFVEVPSRMAGARDPNNREIPGSTGGYSLMDRVVGKININTIWEQEILAAACNNHVVSLDPPATWYPGAIPTFDAATGVPLPIVNSPQPGQILADPYFHPYVRYGGASSQLREDGEVTAELWRRILVSIANPRTPMVIHATPTNMPIVSIPAGDGTLFTPDDRPFRSATYGYPNTSGTALPLAKPPSIQDTIFRGNLPFSATPNDRTRPMFSNDLTSPPPGLDAAAGAPPDLGAYPEFQWQAYQKLSNMVTTRSNTYAVWVTIGFVDVLNEDPNRLSAVGIADAPPELGAEVNADTGQNVRHRAFFMIDRSRARGYLGPPRSSQELQDILSQVVVHSRMIE